MRLTPLNIVMGGVLTWLLWQGFTEDISYAQMGWILFLLIILVAADQLFRFFLRDLKKIWWVEGGFLLLVLAISWLVRQF